MLNNLIIKKKGKYYNVATKKYISEKYAKRLISFFEKNPDKTLIHARGHYDREALIKEKRSEQILKTYSKKGKPILYSYSEDRVIKRKKPSYNLDGVVNGCQYSLFRSTIDRGKIGHVVYLEINNVKILEEDKQNFINAMLFVYGKYCKQKSVLNWHINLYVGFSLTDHENKPIKTGDFHGNDVYSSKQLKKLLWRFLDSYDGYGEKINETPYKDFIFTGIKCFIEVDYDDLEGTFAQFRRGVDSNYLG